ncbi:MAG: hypothetical protein KIT09_11575 [Bryobacteraceae bacterium]|nr:hypothetical protein [Bryobacteraceae bacterium]
MRYRTLGRTGLSVSEIGFGAWGIGGAMWRGSDDDASPAALRRPATVESSCSVSGQGSLDEATLEILRRRAWTRNFYELMPPHAH